MAKAKPESSAKAESVAWWQEKYREDRQRVYDAMMQSIDAVKTGYFYCEGCETKVAFSYPDLRALNDLADKLLKFSQTMPRPDGDEGGGGLTVVRRIVVPGESEAEPE